MPHPEHLLCRNGWYHFRIRIPNDLSSYFSSYEFRKSLKTKDIFLAQNLRKMYLVDIGKIFTLLRTGLLNREQIQDIVRTSCLAQLALHEERREAGESSYIGSVRLPILDDDIRKTKTSLAELDFQSHSAQIMTLITEHNLEVTETSDEYRTVM